MNVKILLAALAAGVATFLLGWVVYGMMLDPYFRTMLTPEGQAAVKDPPLIGGILVSQFVWGLLLAVIYSRWANITTFKTGAIAGAVISFLIALSVDISFYAMWNMSSMNMIFIDPIASGVLGAVGGGVVGWVLGYGQRQAA